MGLPFRSGQRQPLRDEEIVELYWQRNENAIKETDIKYQKQLIAIAHNIVHDKLDCEECLNDTYLNTWNAIPPAKPFAFLAFLSTIMRRIAVNRYYENTRKKRIPAELTASLSDLEDFIEDKDMNEELDTAELGKIISKYIHSLTDRQMYIFISRYYFAEPIHQIMSTLHVSKSTVNKEIATIKSGLKCILEQEGYVI